MRFALFSAVSFPAPDACVALLLVGATILGFRISCLQQDDASRRLIAWPSFAVGLMGAMFFSEQVAGLDSFIGKACGVSLAGLLLGLTLPILASAPRGSASQRGRRRRDAILRSGQFDRDTLRLDKRTLERACRHIAFLRIEPGTRLQWRSKGLTGSESWISRGIVLRRRFEDQDKRQLLTALMIVSLASGSLGVILAVTAGLSIGVWGGSALFAVLGFAGALFFNAWQVFCESHAHDVDVDAANREVRWKNRLGIESESVENAKQVLVECIGRRTRHRGAALSIVFGHETVRVPETSESEPHPDRTMSHLIPLGAAVAEILNVKLSHPQFGLDPFVDEPPHPLLRPPAVIAITWITVATYLAFLLTLTPEVN